MIVTQEMKVNRTMNRLGEDLRRKRCNCRMPWDPKKRQFKNEIIETVQTPVGIVWVGVCTRCAQIRLAAV